MENINIQPAIELSKTDKAKKKKKKVLKKERVNTFHTK